MSLPFDLWQHCYEARRDVNAALDTIRRGGTLSANLWAAYVWYLSGIPTMKLIRDGSTIHFLTPKRTNGSDENDPFYCFVSEICKTNSAWVRNLGAVKMRELLQLLDDEQQRRWGWNALCGSGNEDAPNLPDLNGSVAQTVDRMSFPDMPTEPTTPKLSVLDGGKRQEVERELAGVGARMQNPVDGFFGEE
jgi:hypothetical protein